MLMGVAVAVLSWLWRFDWLPPELWEDVAVAAGLRPPQEPFPLAWHALMSLAFRWLPPARAIHLLLVGGHVAIGVVAALAALILEETAPTVMRKLVRRGGWSRWIVRLTLMQGVALFVFSDPVWSIGRAFCPVALHVILAQTAILVFLRTALRRGRLAALYWVMALLGMLAAETPLGIVLAIAVLAVVHAKAGANADARENPLADPFVRTVVMRRMSFAAMYGWLAVTVVNVTFFCLSDGLSAHEWTGFLLAVNHLYQHVKIVGAAAAPSGWLLMAIVVVVPLVLSAVHVQVATDDDRFLQYWYGVFFAVMGLVMFLQMSGWRSFWFWTWTGMSDSVSSPLLKCLCMALCAQTATYALSVLAVEVYFRNYRRIAGIRYQDSVEDTALGAGLAASFRKLSRWGRKAVRFEPIVLLALLLPFRAQPVARSIARSLHEYAAQTAQECLDSRYLFTDGALDAAVELCALVQGLEVRTVSLKGGGTPRDQYIRARMAEDEEDRDMLRYSGVDALRTWIRFKPARMRSVALQLGFELWGRNVPPPPCAGLVARVAGFPEEFADSGVRAAHALAARVMALYGQDEQLESLSPSLRDVLSFMQWRLARMCRVRADRWDRQRKMKEALDESHRADGLDARNVSFARVRRQMEMGGQGGMRLTPREGMKLGMDRADFKMAEVFARQILLSDPDDLAANFVVGMNYFGEEQYGRAEVYLAKCLARRPDDPVVLNNLAVAQMRLGSLDEAERNARRALAVRADAPEAKRTLENILKRKKEVAEESSGIRNLPPPH